MLEPKIEEFDNGGDELTSKEYLTKLIDRQMKLIKIYNERKKTVSF